MNPTSPGLATIAATPTEILRLNSGSYKVIAIDLENTGTNPLTGFEIQNRSYNWPDSEKGWQTVASIPAHYTDPPANSPISASHDAGNNDPTTLIAGATISLSINLGNYPYLRIRATSENGTQLSYGYTLMGGD